MPSKTKSAMWRTKQHNFKSQPSCWTALPSLVKPALILHDDYHEPTNKRNNCRQSHGHPPFAFCPPCYSSWHDDLTKLSITAALLVAALTCGASTIEGKVVGVSDGDTITVLDSSKMQHKIRLSGIDAPEKAQPFGNRSKESLSDLVFDNPVTVDTDKRDRYGRNVGKVLIDVTDANLEQIKPGTAWHYKAYEREQPDVDR